MALVNNKSLVVWHARFCIRQLRVVGTWVAVAYGERSKSLPLK